MKKLYVITFILAILLAFNIVYTEPTVWYVHPDSTLNSIQAGLDSCADNDIVLVGPGTYFENLIWPNTQGIHMIGELGPEVTIIDGDTISNVIICATSIDTTTVIRGFTIQNGYSGVSGLGGGIYCYGASPVIADNIIKNNKAEDQSEYGFGGGIYIYHSNAMIIDNLVNGNWSKCGGGIACVNSSPLIEFNTITDNHVTGSSPDSCVKFSDLLLHDYMRQGEGHGAGIALVDSSTGIIFGNNINNNMCHGIGGGGAGICCYNGSTPLIDSNNITYNNGGIATGGGGISCVSSSPIITRNTIMNNNIAAGGGVGIALGTSSPIIMNNIISLNSAGWFTVGSSGGGIGCSGYSTALIYKNSITMNVLIQDGSGGGIFCFQSTPTIRANDISLNDASYGAGILCTDTAAPFIDSCTITGNIGGGGIFSRRRAMPEIHYNNIFNNEGDGVRNIDANVIVNAEYNWWGDSTGPYHPDSNPGGLGDSVSDYVDFIPWQYWPGVEDRPATNPLAKNNFMGATILSGPLQLPDGKPCRVFDITGRTVVPDKIKPGIYFIEIDGQIVKKVIKVR